MDRTPQKKTFNASNSNTYSKKINVFLQCVGVFFTCVSIAACSGSGKNNAQKKDAPTAYTCEPITDIYASYENDNAVLNIADQKYVLKKVENKEEGVSAAYTTENGMDGENGMQWLVMKEGNAKIRTLTKDIETKPEDEVVLYECHVTEESDKPEDIATTNVNQAVSSDESQNSNVQADTNDIYNNENPQTSDDTTDLAENKTVNTTN